MHRGYVPTVAAAQYFFLSYAREAHIDGPGPSEANFWVGKLFGDLVQCVKQVAGLPQGVNSGFMDTERRTGNEWPLGLTQALATCRVFVPLYSRSYFADDYCGREWAYFARRARSHAGRASGNVAAIVPGIWEPVGPGGLPPVARPLQPRFVGSGAYESLGLYGIIRLSRFRNDYAEAVRDLSCRIVAAAEHPPAKEGPSAGFDALHSAFGVADRAPPGGKRLRITIIAPRRDKLPDGRRSASFYGMSTLDWSPYGPDFPHPIARHAAEVARDLGFRAEVGELDQHEKGLLSGGLSAGPQVLLIDPWALFEPHVQHLLERLDDDAHRAPWVQAVILLASGDDESQQAAKKLRAVLEAAFGHKLAEVASTSELAAQGVPSATEFAEVLRQLIMAAAKRYLGRATGYPPAGEVIERPRLSASEQHPG